MSEDLLVRHCSPTLAGIKTGNLFSCPCTSRTDLTKELCRLNKKLVPKGIRVLPLRVRKGRALIYVYRPHALECDLADQRARALLLKYGYAPENPNCCVVHLIRRLCAERGISSWDRPVFKLSAGRRVRFYPKWSLQAQVCGMLEGLRRRTNSKEYVWKVRYVQQSLLPAVAAREVHWAAHSSWLMFLP